MTAKIECIVLKYKISTVSIKTCIITFLTVLFWKTTFVASFKNICRKLDMAEKGNLYRDFLEETNIFINSEKISMKKTVVC